MRLLGQRMSVGTRAATLEWLTTMSRQVDENGHFSFYKFTACTSTLKSINLPHSSRLISDASNFAFELRSSILVLRCVCVASCVLRLRHVIVALYLCLSRHSSAILASYLSLSNLPLKSIVAVCRVTHESLCRVCVT